MADPGSSRRGGTPTTIIARWSVANSQSAVPIIARTISNNLGGHGTGRRSIQIRPFRLPGSTSGTTGKGSGGAMRMDNRDLAGKRQDEGRHMYVVRLLSHSNAEQVLVFVEDPSAPLKTASPGLELSLPAGAPPAKAPPHTRWTFCALGGALGIPVASTPFDAFLQRVLIGNSSTNNTPSVGAWIPRSTAISIDGFVFATGGVGGTFGDWEVRVGSVAVKGGAAGANSRGVLVEATYLAVPYLPASSTYVKDFVSSLFPPQALAAGEIEWLSVTNDEFYEAGLVTPPDASKDEEEGEWEWTERHTAFTIVKMLKREGML